MSKMSNTKTGGPAFPTEHTDTSGQFDGMTLRDYFAAHAPLTMGDALDHMRAAGRDKATFWELMETLAWMRAVYADAMLKAKEA